MFGRYFKQFVVADDGAVTVDWVVLTAALVLLGVLILGAVGTGAETLANDLRDDMIATAN